MYQEEFAAVVVAAKKKCSLFKTNRWGFFIASMLAGIFVGLGIVLIYTIGGILNGAFFTKIIMGMCFGIALSLVIIAGAELFTGNNLIMSAGVLARQVTLKETLKIWLFCHVGNWLGAVVIAFLFVQAGYATGGVGEFIAASAMTKISIPFFQLVLRGLLCNILVCLAVWCSFRCKSDSGKLIMIFWCIFALITSGYEHSIANMTLLTIALMAPFKEAITVTGYFYNIFVVSLGNMVGGILFVSLPYFIISRKENNVGDNM